MKKLASRWGLVVWAALTPAWAFAQAPSAPTEVVAQEPRASLKSRLAVQVAERLLSFDSSNGRVRAVERLARSGRREAVDRLVRSLDLGSPVYRDFRARLTAVRGLAPYASLESVRQFFERVLTSEVEENQLSSVTIGTAALALAESGDERAIKILVDLVRTQPVTHLAGAERFDSVLAATNALLCYPPRSLAVFGPPSDGYPPMVSRLLGLLGDLRAIPALRGTLARGLVRQSAAEGADEGQVDEQPSDLDQQQADEDTRVEAALALARLGDQEQVPVARQWLESPRPALKLAATQILLASAPAEGQRALAAVLASGQATGLAMSLVRDSPGPLLLAPLLTLARSPKSMGPLAVAALGQISGSFAVTELATLTRERDWHVAALALALAHGDEARRALEVTEKAPHVARLFARASVVRAVALGDPPRGLVDQLRALLASRAAEDRAAGAFGISALGEGNVSDLVRSSDPVVVSAAARAALLWDGAAVRAAVDRLTTEKDRTLRAALGLALATSVDASSPLSTDRLIAWAQANEPFSPLALVALGTREVAGEESRLDRYLRSEDAVVRAHAALALAQSPLPTAASRLAEAWRFEGDGVVRRNIVIALAQRREPQRLEVLTLAEHLDPDRGVREAARLALSEQLPFTLGQLGAGCARAARLTGNCHVAWISGRSLGPALSRPPKTAALSAPINGGRAGRYLDPSGLALPVVIDPDDALIVPGVSPGKGSFDLASSASRDEAQPHDPREGDPPGSERRRGGGERVR